MSTNLLTMAYTVSNVGEWICSLRAMFLRCVMTVWMEMKSWSAISLLESPFTTQVMISFVKELGSKKNFVLHLYSPRAYTPVFETLSYLLEHRLYTGKIAIGIFVDTAARAYDSLCEFYKELTDRDSITLATEVILTVPDFADGLQDRLRALFRLYPRGGLIFGGVLTDSPAYFIADQVALSAWNEA